MEWKTICFIGEIKIKEKCYEINKFGVVRTIGDREILPYTKGRNDGYVQVSVQLELGGRKQFFIHRLMYQTWYDVVLKTEDIIHHKDDNPSNNELSNLELTDQKGNIAYAIEKGRFKVKGEDNVTARLTEKQVRIICQNLQDQPNKKYKDVLKEAGLEDTRQNLDLVTKIKNKVLWCHVSDEYTWKLTKRECMGSHAHLVVPVIELLERGHTVLEISYILKIPREKKELCRFYKFAKRQEDKLKQTNKA